MPRKLKTRCRVRGCAALTRNGYCKQHWGERTRRPADRLRGSAAERGYDARWRRVREVYFHAHPYCEDCLAEGVLNDQHIEVDHVLPIDIRPDLRLSLDNLRSRCRRHHQQKTAQDRQRRSPTPGGAQNLAGFGPKPPVSRRVNSREIEHRGEPFQE